MEVGVSKNGMGGHGTLKIQKQMKLFNGSGSYEPFAKLALPFSTSHPSTGLLL